MFNSKTQNSILILCKQRELQHKLLSKNQTLLLIPALALLEACGATGIAKLHTLPTTPNDSLGYGSDNPDVVPDDVVITSAEDIEKIYAPEAINDFDVPESDVLEEDTPNQVPNQVIEATTEVAPPQTVDSIATVEPATSDIATDLVAHSKVGEPPRQLKTPSTPQGRGVFSL